VRCRRAGNKERSRMREEKVGSAGCEEPLPNHILGADRGCASRVATHFSETGESRGTPVFVGP
jgi:hypothetical protein